VDKMYIKELGMKKSLLLMMFCSVMSMSATDGSGWAGRLAGMLGSATQKLQNLSTVAATTTANASLAAGQMSGQLAAAAATTMANTQRAVAQAQQNVAQGMVAGMAAAQQNAAPGAITQQAGAPVQTAAVAADPTMQPVAPVAPADDKEEDDDAPDAQVVSAVTNEAAAIAQEQEAQSDQQESKEQNKVIADAAAALGISLEQQDIDAITAPPSVASVDDDSADAVDQDDQGTEQ